MIMSNPQSMKQKEKIRRKKLIQKERYWINQEMRDRVNELEQEGTISTQQAVIIKVMLALTFIALIVKVCLTIY
jgi:hypothetical protein